MLSKICLRKQIFSQLVVRITVLLWLEFIWRGQMYVVHTHKAETSIQITASVYFSLSRNFVDFQRSGGFCYCSSAAMTIIFSKSQTLSKLDSSMGMSLTHKGGHFLFIDSARVQLLLIQLEFSHKLH